MRLLEEHNPDVQFDWPRLLKDVPQDQGPRRERDRESRDRDRRERRDARPSSRPRPLDTTAAAVPSVPPPAVHEATAENADERAEAHAELLLEHVEHVEHAEAAVQNVDESLAVAHGEPAGADHAEYVEYAEAARSDTSSPIPDPRSPIPHPCAAEARLGADGVTRLRLRYAQLVVRLGEKPMEEDVRAELNARLERLNPDAWLTADEVAAALEQYEAVFESLRSHVGHQPRRKL